MAGNIFNEKDSMDINELVSLNEDFSPEFLEQLQQKLQQDVANIAQPAPEGGGASTEDVTTLFEEPQEQKIEEPEPVQEKAPEPPKERPKVEQNFDDNFIKKYKAKLNKQDKEEKNDAAEKLNVAGAAFSETEQKPEETPKIDSNNINKVSNGNITEKEITKDLKSYNDSLDFLDGNVKYTKYVIYIDPQNVNFIEGLTVKERKNLINKILREQDDIAITKHRFSIIQTVIKHAIIAIITIAISVPVIYFVVNASLEASINNYRRSQSNFQVLYKEKGKIRTTK